MRLISRWGPLVLWSAVIFAFSHMPDLHSGLSYDYPLRKLAHVLEYGLLALCARRAFGTSLAAGAYSAAYAVLDEWHQSFVPGRAGAASDVLIDLIGVTAALIFSRARVILKQYR